MAKFKNIRIPKRGGGSRLQRVQVLASGKYKFVKNPPKSKSSNPRTVKGPRKVRRKLARRKKRRRSSGMTIPMAPIAGLAAGMAEPVQIALSGDYARAAGVLCKNFTGVEGVEHGHPVFRIENLSAGLTPLVVGLLVHKFVGGAPLNLNRVLARAKVPFIRI